MKKIKISVVVCTCNGEKYITEQIQSIIHQTYPPDEIIISDDKSDDKTVKIIKKILENTDISYTLLINRERLGVAKNFLRGLKVSSGDYVFCSDQDDVWKKDKIECFLKYIKKSHKDLYFSDGLLVDSNGKSLGTTLWDSLHFKYKEFSYDNAEQLLLKNLFVTGAAMAVSSVLIKSIEEIPNGWLHDGWFSVIAVQNKSIEAINLSTFYYRQHENNVIGSVDKKFINRFLRWKNNIAILKKLRYERYLRYISMKEQGCQEYNKEINDCISFWKELYTIQFNTKAKSFKIIVKNIRNGNYSKFYTGVKGALRDIISLLY